MNSMRVDFLPFDLYKLIDKCVLIINIIWLTQPFLLQSASNWFWSGLMSGGVWKMVILLDVIYGHSLKPFSKSKFEIISSAWIVFVNKKTDKN